MEIKPEDIQSIVYFDDEFNPVNEAEATMAEIRTKDGSSFFVQMEPKMAEPPP